MVVHDTRRRLFWHGIFLFFLGLLSGILMQTMMNPRMGLAAHTSGVASGTFLAVLGAVWGELRLGTRGEVAAYLARGLRPERHGDSGTGYSILITLTASPCEVG